MNRLAPIVPLVDIVLAMSNLWDNSTNSLFVDSSEEGFLACSLTFFKNNERATVGLVYTKEGGAARIFDGHMSVVAQTLEKISQEDYYGLYHMMLQIQEELPTPEGLFKEDVFKKE